MPALGHPADKVGGDPVVAGIHVFRVTAMTWMAGPSPAMTMLYLCFLPFHGRCGEVRIRERRDTCSELLAQNTRPHLLDLAGREISELKGAE